MHFRTWIDIKSAYFDTAHFPHSLQKFPSKERRCYLMLGKVEVNFQFPTAAIYKMTKMPFITDPRYSRG